MPPEKARQRMMYWSAVGVVSVVVCLTLNMLWPLIIFVVGCVGMTAEAIRMRRADRAREQAER
jgi:hypothetical protein